MIFNLLAVPLIGLLQLFVSLFPTANVDNVAQLNTQLSAFRDFIASMDWIVPVPLFFSLLSLIFVIESSYFTYKFVKWLISTLSIGLLK